MDVLLFPFLRDWESLWCLGTGQGEGLMSSTTGVSAMHGKLQHLELYFEIWFINSKSEV